WINLTTQGKIHYKAKFFPLEPLPNPSPDFLANLKEKPFDRSTFYVLVTLQAPNGGFPPSDKLANLFGFESQDQLLDLYKRQCREDRILKNDPTVWTTSMILWFLRFLLKDYRSEWGGVYERAEQYISKAINDLEIEETVVATGRKAVRERFDIKIDHDPKTKRITRETISITHIKRLLKCQQQSTGAYIVGDDLAKSLGYENMDKLRIAFNEYKNSHSKSQKISQVSLQTWMTMLMLYFYRYVAIDQKREWFPTYEKSYRWIWAQLKGNESLEQECFQIVKSFVKESHGVKDDVLELDRAFEDEISEMTTSIKYPQKSRGIVQKPHGIARIEIICAKNLKQADSWFGGSASDPYVRISNIVTSWVYGDSRVIYNNCNPVWEQVFYIPVYDVHEKFNLQVYDYNAFFKDTLLGFYILDLKSIIKELPNGSFEGKQLKLDANLTYKGVNRGQLSFVADFFSLPDSNYLEVISPTTISVRHLYLLMTYQSQYGCFELTDALARLFNYSSKEELVQAFSDFVQKDDGIRSLDHKVWATVLITSFLKVLMWEQRREWMNIYNRAESWLSENVTDVEVEERLYNYSNKFVIQRFKVTQWIDENQQRSVGVLVISKKSIITRKHVDIRIVRRFISYQNESGCFELTPQLAEALGFSSVEEAKKHIETHFSSYSPRTAKFDANVWTNNWLCQQVKDEKVRDELLEAARNFVVKRFEVDNDAIEEDESFNESINNRERGMVDHYDEQHDFIVPNDEVVGIIRICIKGAKDLKKSDFWFTFSNPDPYVRIMNAAGAEIVRTSVCHGTVTPKWDEIHFVSVHGSGEKISFEIFDENLFVSDKPLGTFVLDTNTLMRSEDHSKPVSDWFPLEIGSKPTKGHLNLEVQFIPTAFTDGQEFVFNRETIKLHHIYMLISWRRANGSFEFTDKLARFFNYKSVDELKEGFLKHISSDQELSKCDLSILSTALTIMYLKVLCWKHYNEWKQIISNSELWVSKEINDINTEDKLYDLCRKFMIERFKVTNFEKEQLEIIQPVKPTIITRKHINIRYIHTLIGHQDDDGCVVLNEKVADYYGFKSVDECLQHLRKYFKTERVTKFHHNVWVTACTIWYLRLIAVDHRHEWIANYEKSSKWLTRQCNGDTNLENEIMECAKKFIVERYAVDKEAIEADESFIAAVKTKDEAIKQEKIAEKRRMTATRNRRQISLSGTKVTRQTTTEALVKKFITYRTKDGGFKITDELAQHLGFLNKESLEIAIRTHFVSDNLVKLPSEILVAAVAIWYFRLLGVDHRQHWSTECDSLHKWISLQINNPQIERELLGSAKEFVITRYNIDDEVVELDAPYQEHLIRDTDLESTKPITSEILDEVIDRNVPEVPKEEQPKAKDTKSFFGGLYEAAAKLEDNIEKAVGFNKDKVDDHEKAEALVVVESASPEKCQEIVSGQKGDGCIELNETVCNELDLPKEEIIGTIQKKITNKKLLSPELSSSLATAINISYLKKAASQHEGELKDKYNKALEYLKKQIGDENAEKELLECTDDFVVENCIKKAIKDKKRNAVATVRNLATPEKCDDITSKQNNDGSFEVSETICKEIDVPVTNVVTEVKKCTQNPKLRSSKSEPWWKTALATSYLNIAAPHHKKQWEDKHNKA
ncbi:1530_t:CDS:2, partial [Cetraspora pellucida]